MLLTIGFIMIGQIPTSLFHVITCISNISCYNMSQQHFIDETSLATLAYVTIVQYNMTIQCLQAPYLFIFHGYSTLVYLLSIYDERRFARKLESKFKINKYFIYFLFLRLRLKFGHFNQYCSTMS